MISGTTSLSLDIAQAAKSSISSTPRERSTIVIQGPPGIGKSSLIEMIRQDCIDNLNKNEEGPKTIPVTIKSKHFLFFQQLGQMTQKTIKELSHVINNNKIKKKIVGILNSLSFVSANGINQPADAEDKLDPGDYTILLMIDEIQSLPTNHCADSLKLLRTGCDGYPIFLVLTGLANSETVLTERGIFRPKIDKVINLQPLPNEEVKTSFGKFVKCYNIQSDPSTTSTWEKLIVTWVDGLPKHLHNALKALGEELLLVGGDLSQVNPYAVKRRAMETRLQYYETYIKTFDAEPKIVGEFMADLGTSANKDKIIEIINRIKSRNKSEKTGSLNFEVLLRNGFIYPHGSPHLGLYRCPIPSLQSIAVTKTGFLLHVSTYAGSEQNLTSCINDDLAINGVDAWGRTPLHIAVEADWPVIVNILLEQGADPNIRDGQNRFPHDLAQTGSEIAHSLQNHRK